MTTQTDAPTLSYCSSCQRQRLIADFARHLDGTIYKTCVTCRAQAKESKANAHAKAAAPKRAINGARDTLFTHIMSINDLPRLQQLLAMAQRIAPLAPQPNGTTGIAPSVAPVVHATLTSQPQTVDLRA